MNPIPYVRASWECLVVHPWLIVLALIVASAVAGVALTFGRAGRPS